MPSKQELKSTAVDLADKLGGIPLELEELTHAELTGLVTDLGAKVRDAKNQTQADGDRQSQEQADAAEQEGDDFPTFIVAPGKSIICRKGVGIKADGDSLSRGDLTMEQFEAFFNAGHIIEG